MAASLPLSRRAPGDAQPVARQPNRTSVAIGVPVLVDPIEISEPAGTVTCCVLVHPTFPAGAVQLTAVSLLPTRRVNVRVSVGPVATGNVTARSPAVVSAFGVNELTLFSLPLAANWPDGARNEVPAGTFTPLPRTAPNAGLPFFHGCDEAPANGEGPGVGRGPRQQRVRCASARLLADD